VGIRLSCIEPDYKALLDPRLIRRMSRVIRMGAAAALACLQEGETPKPDAIVTGTAYGCLEDTGLFLHNMIDRGEEMLQPASFIQSTHNTVGAQIALLLQCTGYNNTFVHRGSSFGSSLLDAIMLLSDNEASSVLVGGVDETTDTSHALLTRFGLYRRQPVSNLDLFNPRAKGTIGGEGAAFFLLGADPSGKDLAKIDGVLEFHQPDRPRLDQPQLHQQLQPQLHQQLLAFLHARHVRPDEIDLVVTGDNGDERGDAIYRQLMESVFPRRPNETFKELCGEYPTAVAFGLWMAANRVHSGAGRILLYNHYLSTYHSAILLSPV
jgi:3-oxoacyl-(acyl-carrier-protein) synthase